MIFIQLPGLPPSENHAYFDKVIPVSNKGGVKHIVKRILRPEGSKYKKEIGSYLVQKYPTELKIMQLNVPLGLAILLDMDVLNKGWPKNAKTRYKKNDAANRIKILQDAIASAGGIDDSQLMTTIASKREGMGKEATYIWLWNVDEEGFIARGLVGS